MGPAVLNSLKRPWGNIVRIPVSPDQHHVFTGGANHAAILWDANTGQFVRDFQGHTDVVRSCAFSPDGQMVLSGGLDGTAKLWDRQTGQLIRSVEASLEVLGYTEYVHAVAFSPDSKRFLTK
jgi:WD40 repeat protein